MNTQGGQGGEQTRVAERKDEQPPALDLQCAHDDGGLHQTQHQGHNPRGHQGGEIDADTRRLACEVLIFLGGFCGHEPDSRCNMPYTPARAWALWAHVKPRALSYAA